ncbi:GNAT family N-acetyltransferase [Streptomyces sp. GbtcB6]|uniref:GNAT family N-acetyltransferase n=1 Tax=Streptomyces sp. GbtcB6 TaxID=2824751 RepID=UPI001C2F1996|nr:GNAT family N-acetyltransferase [Streptomyces sp. GbtcB6]
MRTLGGDQVEEAVAGSVAALRAAPDRDWTEVKAGRLEWSVRETAVHLAGALIAYAGQLAGRAETAYVPFELVLEDGADDAGVLHVVQTTGALLAVTVRSTPREVRAFHPYPSHRADRTGFAAMGVAELLLHTHDMAEGLGIPYRPAEELAESVLTHLFPHVQPGPTPWQTLLWATGRGELPGRAPVTGWRWYNNLVIPAERLDLVGIRPAEARDLRLGGDGGFEWIEGGPYEGTRDAAGFLLKAYEGGVHRPEFGVFALVSREDGRAVGGMGFHSAPDEDGRVEIGYDLAEAARGRGYATEALRALTDWAFAREDVRSLFATIEAANTPSQAVVTRAGFAKVSEDENEVAFELRAP